MSYHDNTCPGSAHRAASSGARRRLLLPLLAVLALWSPAPAMAASTDEPCGFNFGDIVIAEGQNLTCDVVVVGGSALVEEGATIDGSLNAVPGSVRVLGVVTGDVSAARDLAISGEVGGNAFAVGGDIELEGKVGANATAARGDIRLSGDASVDGQVSARGDVILADGAHVGGDVVAGGTVDAASGAEVEGKTEAGNTGSGYASVPGKQDPQEGVIQTLMALAVVILAVLFAALTAMAAPGRVARIADAASGSPLLMVLLGLIALLATPPALFLILPLFLAPIAMAMGWVGLGQAWGRRVAPARSATLQTALGSLLLAAVTVLVIVTLFSVSSVAAICGLGLLLLLPLAWAYAAGIATLLGSRPFTRGALGPEPRGNAPDAAIAPLPQPGAPSPGMPSPGMPQSPAPAADAGAQVGGDDGARVGGDDGARVGGDDGARVGGDDGALPPSYTELPVVELRPGPAAEGLSPPPLGTDLPAQAPVPVGAGQPSIPASPYLAAVSLEPGPLAEPGPAPVTAAAVEPAITVVEPHDQARHGLPLRQVLGLSPIYAELLRSAGIKGARDLAALSPDEAARLTAAPGVLPVGVDKAAAWIRSARALLSEAG